MLLHAMPELRTKHDKGIAYTKNSILSLMLFVLVPISNLGGYRFEQFKKMSNKPVNKES